MFVNLKPYAAMKNAGVEWLGEVPAHWEVKRTKSLLARNDSGVWGSDFDDDGVIVLRSTEQTVNGEWNISAPARRRLTASEYSACHLEEGDLLVTKSSGSALHIGKTSIVTKDVAALDCCFSNFMQRLRVKQNTIPRFVWYALNGELGRRQLDYFSDTTTGLANLNGTIIGSVTLASPPLPEQTAIVRFLDHADRRIWRYIRAKQKLIALLEEQKQAIIHQAVTGQIDVRTGQPYPAYKPSGVEWLREVTEHWDVFRLATICNKITNGYVGPTRDILVSDGVRYLQSLHIKRNQIQFDGKYFVEESWSRAHAKSILMEGDVLVVQTGDIGQVAVVPREFEGSNCHALIILSCRPSYASGQFVSLVLNSNYGFHSLNLIKTGALHPHLNCTFVREIHIALPPLNAQHTIATYLNRETAIIDALIEKIKKAIALLREYRTSLIADVVTGKLDVREAAAALPKVDSRAADDSLDDTFDADAELPLDELDATLEEANI